MKSLVLTIAALAMLAGCAPDQVGQAVNLAKQADPAVAAKIDAACPAVQTGLALAAMVAKGGAAQTVANNKAIADASCTPEGKADLLANDTTKPVSVTNSGDSAKFLLGLEEAAAMAIKVGSLL